MDATRREDERMTREEAEEHALHICQTVGVDDETARLSGLAAYLIGLVEDKDKRIAELEIECSELAIWVNDLQSGMYINCVYCGHRYGPDPGTPVAMADVLKAHIEACPKHPMSVIKRERDEARAALREVNVRVCAGCQDISVVTEKGGGRWRGDVAAIWLVAELEKELTEERARNVKLAGALKTAINTVECASIDLHTGEDLPWYKQAQAAIEAARSKP